MAEGCYEEQLWEETSVVALQTALKQTLALRNAGGLASSHRCGCAPRHLEAIGVLPPPVAPLPHLQDLAHEGEAVGVHAAAFDAQHHIPRLDLGAVNHSVLRDKEADRGSGEHSCMRLPGSSERLGAVQGGGEPRWTLEIAGRLLMGAPAQQGAATAPPQLRTFLTAPTAKPARSYSPGE